MAVRTAGLRNLQRQLDAAFPGRRRPDGWIGDAAHRGRTSGHNPDDTPGSKPAWDHDPDNLAEVRALDVSADLGDGMTGQHLVDHLVRLPGLASVVRYLIHRGRIYHARSGFQPQPHDGDPHAGHVHIEQAWSQAADSNTSFDYRLEMIPVALTAQDKAWMAAQITSAAEVAATSAVAEVIRRLDGAPIRLTREVGPDGRRERDPDRDRSMGGSIDALCHLAHEQVGMSREQLALLRDIQVAVKPPPDAEPQ